MIHAKLNTRLLEVKTPRLFFIDGLRGIAILLVIFYHAFSYRWSNYLPYGNTYSHISVFQFGNYGVQLFFMISGFVITMTLEKCANFWDFMYRRWLRLFPAMLIGSLTILITAPLLTARPYGPPALLDIIPGITFIEPEFYRSMFGYYQGILEGSFWSLFVEMKFYVLAGILYFTMGTKKMIMVLIVMFFASVLAAQVSAHLSKQLADELAQWMHYLNWNHYGWFATGALFHLFHTQQKWHFWLAAVLVALLSARGLGGFLSISMIMASTIVAIMAFAMINLPMQKLLSAQWLVLIGFVSYPLYLLHENAMVSMINQFYSTDFWIPNYFLPLLAMIPIFFLAWLITQYLEPRLTRFIKTNIKKFSLI